MSNQQFASRYARFIILLVLLLATFLRFYRLPDLPPGLNFDEAGNGVAALDILAGSPRIWWPIGGGKEPLWPYLIAFSTAASGYTPLALRIPAALFGLLTVAALYPLSLALFRGPQARNLALLATAGLAFSGWHLHFSRLGFRAILLPLFSILAFYFLWRRLTDRTVSPGRQRWEQSLTALFLALAIYAYLAARLLPIVLIFFFMLDWLIATAFGSRHSSFITHRSSFVIRLFSLLILFLLPLALYFAFHPADFTARAGAVSIFNPEWNRGDLAGTAWLTLRRTLGTFLGLTGDPNPLVNLPGQPALPLLVVPFFLTGLGTCLYRLFGSPAPETTPKTSLRSSYLFLLCWWSIMLLPAILAPEGAPHHLRLIGTLIPTYLLIALGFVTIIPFLTRLFSTLLPTPYSPLPTPLLLAGCYLLLAFQTYSHYFQRWPVSVDFTLPFDLYAARLAAEIAQAPPEVAYVLPMDIRAGSEARHYSLDYLLAPFQIRPKLTGSLNEPTGQSYVYLPVDEGNAVRLLTQAAAGRQELHLVRWRADKHLAADEKEIVTFLLETTLQPLGSESFPIYDIERYAWPEPAPTFRLPAIDRPIGAIFDGLLRLDAAYLQPTASPGDHLALALTLAPLAPMNVDYKASIRLIGPDRARVAQKDRTLRHNFHQGTSLWPPETVNEYYLLSLPSDLSPGRYTVVIVIYRPDTQAPLVASGLVELPLGQVAIK